MTFRKYVKFLILELNSKDQELLCCNFILCWLIMCVFKIWMLLKVLTFVVASSAHSAKHIIALQRFT